MYYSYGYPYTDVDTVLTTDTRVHRYMTLLTVLTAPRWTGGTGIALQASLSRESGHGGPSRPVMINKASHD